MVYAALICRTVIGLVFAVSAFSKLRNGTAYREFASWLASVPVPLARNRFLPPVLAGALTGTCGSPARPARRSAASPPPQAPDRDTVHIAWTDSRAGPGPSQIRALPAGITDSADTSARLRAGLASGEPCAAVVYLRTGQDSYQAYALEGGP